MEGQLQNQLRNQFYLSEGIKFKSTQSDKSQYKIFRRRSVTSLNKKDRLSSPNPNNFKQKHLMYKKDLLQQKFQNLQVNNFQKEQKRPLKLKLQKVNKENNLVVMKQLNEISNEIEIKFQAQNSLIRKSLDRMEKIVTKNVPLQAIERMDLSRKKKIEQKLPENIQSQYQKSLKFQMQSLNEEKRKLQDDLKSIKSVNSFLTSQNYKLSMENSMLKSKIVEYEQADYENALKTEEDMESEQNEAAMSEVKIDQQEAQKNFKKIESNQSINIDQLSKRFHGQEVLIKQISTQIFSLESRQIQERNQFDPLEIIPQVSQSSMTLQNCKVLSQQFEKLTNKINQLEQELDEQRNVNDQLSNKIAALKLYNHASKANQKQKKQEEYSFESAISIKMDLKQKQQSGEHQQIYYCQDFQIIKQPAKKSQISIAKLSHKASKSKILSNQIIYFAENIPNQKEKTDKSRTSIKSKETLLQSEVKQAQNQQNVPLDTINQEDEDQKKKTLCMMKLQIPAEETKKRRKSISEKLNFCLQKKQKNLNLNNSLSFYSNNKVNLLQMIRETISLKFEAFKYTFELFQNQMILWPNGKATTKQLKSILSEYPFFLEEGTIYFLLSYCNIVEGKDTRVDLFCNKVREFISEYEEMTEEEQLVLEKKIYKRWKYTKQEILENMKKNESDEGQITKSRFTSVLDEFKFQDKQIHYLLSQSVALSSDINHIKYRQYLENFLKQQ